LILLQCDYTNIISSITWWNPAPLPITQKGTGSTQRSSRRYVRSSPTWTEAWGPTSKTWLLLAKDDFWRHHLR